VTDDAEQNKYFYMSNISTSAQIYGISKFVLTNVDSIEKYNSLQLGALIFECWVGQLTIPFLKIYEMAIAFRKSVSIKDAVYSPFSGRIFNNTWSSRRTSANLMESPLDILEYACRLQNSYENCAMPTAGWGKGYASGALIKTSGDGSFDAVDGELLVIRDAKTRFQILDMDNADTDKIKRTLCKNFNLASWVDKDGYECVKRIKKSVTSPADSITLADIIDRTAIKITDPEAGTIYPEPFVRYNYNSATEDYESAIRIKNTSAALFVASYVEGMTGADAEEYWDRCKLLWNKAKQINDPPSELTDLDFIGGADADALALEYLTTWIDWMFNPTIEFDVHFNKAGSWEECHRFTLTLPHQTNNAAIECIVTDIEANPNAPYDVHIKAIMYSETIPEDFNIREIMTMTVPDWQETTTVYGTDNDKIEVM
jgi:hypothetical protein